MNKHLRAKKQEAKKIAFETKKIIKHMEGYLTSSHPQSIEIAWAFFRSFAYHIEHGDLRPEHINLIRLIRNKEDE